MRMQITRTINADRRYYLDEDMIQNSASILSTIAQFNDMKIVLYNALYDKKYQKTGPLCDTTYSVWLKERFQTNDYYNCAVYTAASGCLSSQKELQKLYIRGLENDLKSRDVKIQAEKEKLEKKQAVKRSIRQYIRAGRWERPYPKCQLKVCGNKVKLPGKKEIPLAEYEYKVEREIRRLKTKLALLADSRKRAEKKKQDLEGHAPRRIVFGSKKRFRQKDQAGTDLSAWKEDFRMARHASMSLPGRHTSRDCNFLAALRGNDLIVRCMDGTATVFHDFHLSRYQDVYEQMLSARPAERRPVCYNFQIKKDQKGRIYLQVSVTLVLENPYVNESLEDGCIAIDLNYDHVALSNIDAAGKRIGGKVLRFDPELKTNGQISEEIGRVMAVVGGYCVKHKKPLLMEDLDTTVSRYGLRYGDTKRNRHASLFAYRKMTACIENQSLKQGFGVLKVNPAYTSQMGKILFMRKLGLSIHAAASYAVGLKGMGFIQLLKPDDSMIRLLPKGMRKKAEGASEIRDLIPVWKKITDTFRGIRPHLFLRALPYEEVQKKKRPSLRSLAAAMKEWDDPFPVSLT